MIGGQFRFNGSFSINPISIGKPGSRSGSEPGMGVAPAVEVVGVATLVDVAEGGTDCDEGVEDETCAVGVGEITAVAG